MHSRKFVVFALLTLIPLPLRAWNGDEHVKIGAEGYHRACLQARSLFSVSNDAAVNERLKLACGIVAPSSDTTNRGVTFAYSALAGDWSRLAADHTATPEQLTSADLGDLVVSYGQMTAIAINNYRHFYPASIASWRHDHAGALEVAVVISHGSGIILAERFEQALAIESFAQHYLQDSFAAGHMGFNRIASSNATALAYHNRMSRRGRCVANENGEAWFTFGDDNLKARDASTAPVHAIATEHVMAASAASFFDFLQAFITGTKGSDRWLEAWKLLPATFDDYLSPSSCTYHSGWPSLRSIAQPAPGVSSIEIFTVTDASIYRPAARALLIGISRDLRPIAIGYREIHTRYFLSLGGTIRQPANREFYIEQGFAAQVGTSARGSLTHELGVGESFVYASHNSHWLSFHSGSLRVFYGARIEAGPVYVRAQAGIADSYGRTGPHVGVGFGWVSK